MFCTKCGQKMTDTSEICPACGSPADDDVHPANSDAEHPEANQFQVKLPESEENVYAPSPEPPVNSNSYPYGNNGAQNPYAAPPAGYQQGYYHQQSYARPIQQNPPRVAVPPVNQSYAPFPGGYPSENEGTQTGREKPLSTGGFIGTMLLFAIPLAGLIMSLVWSFSKRVNINRRNYSRAYLILFLAGAAIAAVSCAVLYLLFGEEIRWWLYTNGFKFLFY